VFANYLKPDGVILLTMPRAENFRADANPGSLNMTVSSGLHYFIPSRMATEALLVEAGFEFQDHSAVGNSQVIYASRKPLNLSSTPLDLNELMLSYCQKKLATDLEFRVRLAYLIDAFEMSIRLKLPTDTLRIEIEQSLAEMNIFLDALDAMSYRVESCETFADLGALIPFGLPKFLRCRAIGDPHWKEILAANMVICAKGLALEGGLLFLYQGILADHYRILKELDHPNLFDRAVEIARSSEIGAVAVQG
jgi:hypothetical protein